ncbi:HAD-IIB family hydrolase [Marinobacter sp. OP 3.4]|uniref:HAD-IIB family hydrolase n=1 Tax=Marinobacter sp. OP 3.4 TaxID=3076501 RepID=UPI002E1BECB1
MDQPRPIFFSDLDGTLLDHDTYDWQPARPALQRLAELDLPLVLNSSKTRPEIEALRRELDNTHPFIVENGAGMVIPAGYFGNGPEEVITAGASRACILEELASQRARDYRFTGFADLPPPELARLTGLSREAAAMAGDRIGTEPILWQDTPERLQTFREGLADRGLQLQQGGRFLHVMGRFDKADGLRQLMSRYRARSPETSWRSVALGDSLNDQDMLAGADLAVIIAGVNADRIELPEGHPVIRSTEPGPTGWNRSVLEVLSRFGYHAD